jgi:DNA-binding NarL/FixJ family response regulator
MQVVGEAATAVMATVAETNCDILLLDLQMERWALDDIRQLATLTKVVVFPSELLVRGVRYTVFVGPAYIRCLVLCQSARKFSSPASVSGCLRICLITLNGSVATWAPVSAARSR